MNTAKKLASDMERTMGIRSELAPPVDLLVLRAGIELSHLAGAETSRADATLIEWVRTIDRSAHPEMLETLRDRYPPSDAAWMTAIRQCASEGEAVHGPLALLALLHLAPRNRAEAKPVWGYIDAATRALDVDPSVLSGLTGWLAGSADAEVSSLVESLIRPLRELGPLAKQIVDGALSAQLESRTGLAAAPLRTLRTKVMEAIKKTAPHLDALHIERTPREKLVCHLESEHFRIAVLGEFKRGKSTLINALVGVPDLMPTATLPCTSALIEIRGGSERRYEVYCDTLRGITRSATPEEFRSTASAAARTVSRRDHTNQGAAKVPAWRVTAPSAFLEQGGVVLIDSPGLGEDYVRDSITRTEAERADAAILVMDASQLASLNEMELIEHMKVKAADLIVAINKADSCPEEEWEDLREHCLSRIRERTDAVSADRVVLLSARHAEAALRNGDLGNAWLKSVDSLRELVERQLVQRAGRIKLHTLQTKVLAFVRDMEAAIERQTVDLRNKLTDLEHLSEACLQSAQRYEAACRDIESGTRILRAAEAPADRIKEAFFAALPKILDEAEAQKDSWVSQRSPLLSPKVHVEEVGSRARDSVLSAVERWMRTEGSYLIGEELARQSALASNSLAALREYLREATGRDPATEVDLLIKEALSGLGSGVGDVSGGDAALRAMLGGTIATVMGYLVADLVLFYLLHAVSGFLNPLLLAAALVGGITLYAIKGEAWVRAWIRRKVAAELRDNLLGKKETREKLAVGIRQAVTELFGKVASSFREGAQRLLNEVRYQQTQSEETLRAYVSKLGTDAPALRAHLAEVERHAAAAWRELAELRKITEAV